MTAMTSIMVPASMKSSDEKGGSPYSSSAYGTFRPDLHEGTGGIDPRIDAKPTAAFQDSCLESRQSAHGQVRSFGFIRFSRARPHSPRHRRRGTCSRRRSCPSRVAPRRDGRPGERDAVHGGKPRRLLKGRDVPARRLATRCRGFVAEPPSAGWIPVTAPDTKEGRAACSLCADGIEVRFRVLINAARVEARMGAGPPAPCAFGTPKGNLLQPTL